MKTFKQFLETHEDLVKLDNEGWLERLRNFLKRKKEGESSITDPGKSIGPGELSTSQGKSFEPIRTKGKELTDLISLADEDWKDLGSTAAMGKPKKVSGFKNSPF